MCFSHTSKLFSEGQSYKIFPFKRTKTFIYYNLWYTGTGDAYNKCRFALYNSDSLS